MGLCVCVCVCVCVSAARVCVCVCVYVYTIHKHISLDDHLIFTTSQVATIIFPQWRDYLHLLLFYFYDRCKYGMPNWVEQSPKVITATEIVGKPFTQELTRLPNSTNMNMNRD